MLCKISLLALASAVLYSTGTIAKPMKRDTITPVMAGQNFPDPSVIKVGSSWYGFATNGKDSKGNMMHIQMATTADFKTWTYNDGTDGMPTLASWIDAASPRVWAPDVSQLADGSFVMYYTAALKSKTNLHCLGVATSKHVQGPYKDSSSTPWVCPTAQGGAIDPSGYLNSDGTRWVVYKIDGNAIGHGGVCGNTVAPIVSTPIMLQQVNAADGVTKIGSPVQLITNGKYDGPVTEAPSLSYLDGKYVLFFSSNCFATPKYDVSYATATNIKGPYTKYGPLFVTGTDGMTAPGGLDIAVNGDHAVWHANYGYVDFRPPRAGFIGLSKHTDDRYRSGRAMFTGLLSQSGNVVKASTLS